MGRDWGVKINLYNCDAATRSTPSFGDDLVMVLGFWDDSGAPRPKGPQGTLSGGLGGAHVGSVAAASLNPQKPKTKPARAQWIQCGPPALSMRSRADPTTPPNPPAKAPQRTPPQGDPNNRGNNNSTASRPPALRETHGLDSRKGSGSKLGPCICFLGGEIISETET